MFDPFIADVPSRISSLIAVHNKRVMNRKLCLCSLVWSRQLDPTRRVSIRGRVEPSHTDQHRCCHRNDATMILFTDSSAEICLTWLIVSLSLSLFTQLSTNCNRSCSTPGRATRKLRLPSKYRFALHHRTVDRPSGSSFQFLC